MVPGLKGYCVRLTTYSDYALRVLIYAAVRPRSFVTIREISEAYGISRNHLMKIANALSQAGYLQTVRGRSGGLRLAKPAHQINIGKVVRMTEAGSVLVECADPKTNRCVITRACKLRHVLHDALEAFYLKLEGTTLADLVDEPQILRTLLVA